MGQLVGRAGGNARSALVAINVAHTVSVNTAAQWFIDVAYGLHDRALGDTRKAEGLLETASHSLAAAASWYSKVDADNASWFAHLDDDDGLKYSLPGLSVPRHYHESEVVRPETAGDFKDAVDAEPAPGTLPTAEDIDVSDLAIQLKEKQDEIFNKATLSTGIRDVSVRLLGVDVLSAIVEVTYGDWYSFALQADALKKSGQTFRGIHANLVRGGYALASRWTGLAANAFLEWNDRMLDAALIHGTFLEAAGSCMTEWAKFSYHQFDAINTALNGVIDVVASIYSYDVTDVLGAIYSILSDQSPESVTSTLFNLLAALAKNLSKAALALNALRYGVSAILATYHLDGAIVQSADATRYDKYQLRWPEMNYRHHSQDY